MDLVELGWSDYFAQSFEPYNRDGLIPARVAARHHGPCELLTERGRIGGVPAGRLHEDELPAVGDWVAARRLPGERRALIEAVLPRRTEFARKEAWRRSVRQVVAANVDTVFVVTAFGGDLNPRRLERYLAATWQSGADPVIVVNKLDLEPSPIVALAPVEAVARGVPVLRLSAATAEGLDALDPWLHRGRTVALLGSSGVGKSSLVNRLDGRRVLATGPLRRDGAGRQTTTKRELVPLPNGALLLDTPGMRELQLWEAGHGVERTFEEVVELAAACRFRDCSHDREPGCEVRAALADGRLEESRYDNWRRLQRELRATAIRRDARLQAERRRWRRVEREQRRPTSR